MTGVKFQRELLIWRMHQKVLDVQAGYAAHGPGTPQHLCTIDFHVTWNNGQERGETT